ncbi:hypothetical protein NCS57_00346700 [Fusarium keratoplasticum]|uniref:Uncharacterized protein n=1 Tax=Fusarium keratoplasticum TaxID=1328300 RepID=A0ACC0R313_9HYPO|nr:hypothetical protein NCS57_00346700 [Fusarium keratoplasticum]KAI8674488.1 hypothetical protein NCS57_00346700 [Fusarium keratoplasticum]
MDRATDETFPPQKRPRTSGLQGEAERIRQSSQGSPFYSYGTGDQFNAPQGKLDITKGPGNQFPGATFHAPVYFGTQEHFDPLRECLRSLAFLEIDNRSNDIDTAATGTCEWLLRHKTYTSWASCGRGLLWIKGKPGSGKSTLLRYVLDYIVAIPNTGEGALILSFFFHGRGSELQKTPFGLFRSLLHQLLRQVPKALTDLMATFQQRCETIGKPGEKWQWHPRELQRFSESSLLKVLRTHPVWLFVDALDECGKENAVKLVEDFESMLQRPPSSDLKRFRICFTCRHYPILNLDGVFEVCVEKENQKDISTFVQDKLSSFRGRTLSTIPDLIIKRADGVFLWAWLIVKQVLDLEREGVGIKSIEAKIRSVPQELDALYCELIRNMGSESLKLVQWICFATRPLSLNELRWAMLIDADCPHRSLYECQSAGDHPSDDDVMKRRVQTLSCGLAEVTSSVRQGLFRREGYIGSGRVQFIHQSVKDFFVEKGLSALDESTKTDFVGIAHHRLSRTCIRYLAMEEIDRSASQKRSDILSEFPLLHYATTSWVAHTKESDARSISQEDLLEYFAGPLNTLMERWVRIYRILDTYSDGCPAEGTSLVHVMSRYGVAGALWAILERTDQVGINIDAKDSHDRTPLLWAATNGHEAVVRLLLDRGAHTEAADKDGRTPLWRAATNGDVAVVRLLLDRGAHTEAANKDGRTPLWRAATNGDVAVVRLLLDRGAHTEAADKEGRTPLWWATAKGLEAVVGLLHTGAADKEGWTPLWRAAGRGDKAVVGLLLDRGAHTEAADKVWGLTPLAQAAARGDKAVVRLLLDRGAHTEAADQGGRTPLWWAAAKGLEAVVRLLLDRGAHTEAADKVWGLTPLAQAAARGDKAVVRLLLDRGAYTEAADQGGRTPLWRAAGRGDKAVVGLLHTEAVDKEGRTPLWRAAGEGDKAVVGLLLDRGAHTEAADKEGRTPLAQAAARGDKAVVRLLLDRGAHTEAADKEGQTPLWMAAENGHEAVVRLLLDRGAHTEAADKVWGSTPLWRAAERGHEAVVRLLLDRGAHTEAADKVWGLTPLAQAAARGDKAVVRLLLDRGAHTEAADQGGRTPLSQAAARGDKAVVRLLQVHIAQPSSTTLR